MTTKVLSLPFTNRDRLFESGLSFVPCSLFPEQADEWKESLHPNEAAYYATLQFERRQKSFLTGRYALKLAMSVIQKETAPTAFEMLKGVFGQPVLSGSIDPLLSMSLTHSQTLAVAIVFPLRHPIGIDSEGVSEKNFKTMQRILTDKEKQKLEETSPFTPPTIAALLWTAKESLGKALLSGFLARIEALEVASLTYEENHPVKITFTHFPHYKGIGFVHGNNVTTIVMPAHSEITTEDQNLIAEVLKDIE